MEPIPYSPLYAFLAPSFSEPIKVYRQFGARAKAARQTTRPAPFNTAGERVSGGDEDESETEKARPGG